MARFSEWLVTKWQRPENLEDARERLDKDMQFVFGTPAGRNVLNALLTEHYCTISHVPGGRCCDTAFNEGQRAVIHEILESLERAEKGNYGRTTDDTGNTDTN